MEQIERDGDLQAGGGGADRARISRRAAVEQIEQGTAETEISRRAAVEQIERGSPGGRRWSRSSEDLQAGAAAGAE
jgi:hypothetical protein